MQETTYGHFDDLNREYVITNPQTPWPWINYLGNEDFFSLISNTAGGYSFCRDAKFRRITRYRYNGVPMDAGGRYFYIKQAPLQLPPVGGESSISGKVSPAGGDLEGASDGVTGWSPGWKPCKTPLDSYECRHGMGYTRLTSSKNGITASVLFFVPLGQRCEVQRLTLMNTGSTAQRLKLFSFQEWCLWNAATDMENFQRNFSTGEVEIDGSVIYHKTEYKERRDHYAFYSVNCPINGYDTDRENFIGLYNGFDAPQVVAEGKARNSVAHGWSPIASHYIELELQPGESRDFIFILGYVENNQEEKFATEATPGLIQSTPSCPEVNKTKAKAIISAFDTVEKVDAAFAQLNAYWDSLLCRFSVTTQEEKFNRMLNIWNQYQCMVTFCMSRSASFFESGIGRGMGFRDSNQDLLGFVHLIPERARQRIIDIASTQFPDGGCYHQYQPLTRRGNNDIGGGFGDDPLWLIFGTVAYIRETGDFSILDEMVPFDNQEGSEQTLMSHLTISLNHVADNLGPHKLPLIGRADWNDCLNLNCFSWNPDESFQTTENNTAGSQAESLMIAGLFVVAARDYSSLCHAVAARKGEVADAKFYADEAARAEQLTEAMNKAVERDGWDGAWYLRAYDFHGKKVGSKENEEGQIFIESQGWCAMAEIGKELGMPAKALDSVKERLDSEHGIVLCNPAFTRYVVEYGEISSYPAGYKENAGIFCHNNPWVIIAEAIAGRGADCWHHYEKICPTYTESHSALHKVEPYVCCQMVAGKDAAVPGEGKNSWLTGTAAWMWYAASQFILGLKPQFDGLEIAPCIPAEWSGFRLTRQFRGATYDIEVDNSAHVEHGIASVTVDGKPVSGNLIPHSAGHHEVKVVMG